MAKRKHDDAPAPRLPVPVKLEPDISTSTLLTCVRGYFYSLYNATNGTFREFLASVGNKDSLTGNRLFDRHEAVSMIKKAAKTAGDQIVENAKDGDIYKCIVNLMRRHDLNLKLRRFEYRRIAHQAPAE